MSTKLKNDYIYEHECVVLYMNDKNENIPIE
jgi:hypothetical protein